eukprot:Opistho-1_new@103877
MSAPAATGAAVSMLVCSKRNWLASVSHWRRLAPTAGASAAGGGAAGGVLPQAAMSRPRPSGRARRALVRWSRRCAFFMRVSSGVVGSGGFPGGAEVGLDHARVAGELAGRPLRAEFAHLEHVAVVGHLQRGARVLLHQHD